MQGITEFEQARLAQIRSKSDLGFKRPSKNSISTLLFEVRGRISGGRFASGMIKRGSDTTIS